MPKITKECFEILENIEKVCPNQPELCVETIETLKKTCKHKKKREPTAFNLFIKHCLAQKKQLNQPHKQKFAICVNEWKKRR